MKITHVEFSALFSLGNYSNEKVGLRAALEEGDTVEDVIEKLRWQCVANSAGKGRAESLYGDIYASERALRELNEKITHATEQWNQVAEFLRAQGIKPDAPNLPAMPTLAPGKPDEVDAEFVL